jgi:iron complex transport system substrate-binding protein
MRQRLTRGLVAVAAVLGLVTSCGAPPEEKAAESSAPAAAGFPVTVTDAKGNVTIPAKPQRVVALGYADISLAQALGANIVGAVKFPQGADGRNFPGLQTPLSAEVASLDMVNPNPEQIQAMTPDLILATSAQPAYHAAYDQLKGIAPTITHKTALLRDSPDEITTTIGTALGEPEKAKQLIEKSNRQLADFATARPYLNGKSYVFGQTMPSGLQLIVGDNALSTQVFSRLGLKVPDTFAGKGNPDDPLGTLTLARENLGQLSAADVGFVFFFEPAFEKDAVLQNLPLVKEKRLQPIDVQQAYALLQPNPANTAYVLETISGTLDKLKV